MNNERSDLVADIHRYLTSDKIGKVLTPEQIRQAISIIEHAVWETLDADDIRSHPRQYPKGWVKYLDALEANGVDVSVAFYGNIAEFFSPPHYQTLVGFVKRFEAIVDAEDAQMEAEIRRVQEAIAEQRYWESARDDFEYADLCPDGEIIVEPTRILARAFVKGLGNRLPKANRKHLGFGSLEYGDCCSEWEFPLSMLPDLQATGLPLLYHPSASGYTPSNHPVPSSPV